MSEFRVDGNPEFAKAWQAAAKDGKIEFDELKALAKIADATEDKSDNELMARLIRDHLEGKEGSFLIQAGTSSKQVTFVDGLHSIRVEPKEVNNDNAREFVLQRLLDYETAVAKLDSKAPDFDKKRTALRKELVDKDLLAALDGITPHGGGAIPEDKVEASFLILQVLNSLSHKKP